MGGKGGGDQQRTTFVTDYYLSIHYGICVGPVDRLIGIIVGDKIAANGSICGLLGSVPETSSLDNSGLFGGVLKEGGVRGTYDWMPGTATQTVTAALASRLGTSITNCPGFRQLASIFFYGGGGFYWGSNSPYIKAVAIAVMRLPFNTERGAQPNISGAPDADWDVWTSLCGIPIDGATIPWTTNECTIYDANPAHIIYESITNQDWGMGNPPWTLDFASFLACAQTLYDEIFGMSILWSKQSTIEDFIQEVLNHIQAVVYIHPRTGLITLKLIRFDYDQYTVPMFTDYNSKIISIKKRLWSDTINEVVVSWTNPFNEESETVRAQNSANIAIQGGVVSDARNYYGVRNGTLAQTLAWRDLRAASAPLTILEFEANREAWDVVVGDVVNVTSSEYGIEALYVRIDNIDYGRPGDPKIKIVASEDIFAYDLAHFVSGPPDTAHTGGSYAPQNFAYQLALDTPYAAITQLGATATYPDEFVTILAAQTDALGGQDTSSYELWGYPSSGSPPVERLTSRSPVTHALLGAALFVETTTTFSDVDFINMTHGGLSPTVGGFIYVQGTNETTSELIQITAYSGGNYTLKRGVLDTIPRTWSAGTPVWFIGNNSAIYDPIRRAVSETLVYDLLAITSQGIIDIGLVFDLDFTVGQRATRPTRPANVEVEGNGTGFVDLTASLSANIDVTWSQRNRLTETTTILEWDDATISPESGQDNNVVVLASNHTTVLDTNTGISGTSFSQDTSVFTGNYVYIVVTSTRDTFDSLQGFETIVQTGAVTPVSISGTPIVEADQAVYVGGYPQTPEYSFIVTAANGIPARIFELIGDWPTGIFIEQTDATHATVHGYPTIVGVYTGLTVRVTDTRGDFDELTIFQIEVLDLPQISMQTDGFFVGPGIINVNVLTDMGSVGTIYWVAYPNAGHDLASAAQIIAGQDDTGGAAANSGSAATGPSGIAFDLTGMTPFEETIIMAVQVITGPHNSNVTYDINYCFD